MLLCIITRDTRKEINAVRREIRNYLLGVLNVQKCKNEVDKIKSNLNPSKPIGAIFDSDSLQPIYKMYNKLKK